MLRNCNTLKPHRWNSDVFGDEPLDQPLIASIRKKGVLVPLTVKADGTIISGHRRWRAAISAGLTEVPVKVEAYASEEEERKAFVDYNRQREKTFSQKMREAAFIEETERMAAKRRQACGQGGVLLPQNFAEATLGETRDKVAEQIGIGSGEQYRKAKKVWAAAEAGDGVAKKAVENLDCGKTTVHAAYGKIVEPPSIEVVPPPTGRYRTIVIDPPWPMKKIIREEAPNQAGFDYPVMSLDEIKALPIADLSVSSGAHLYLWTTQKYLPESFEVLKNWGFTYIFTMVWHKTGGFQPFNLPQYNCEFVLFGRKGNLPFLDTKAFSTCFGGQRREHSRKPEIFYDLVRRVSLAPRIDYFSREKREGFEQYGNETNRY